jgi:hypothetical protein
MGDERLALFLCLFTMAVNFFTILNWDILCLLEQYLAVLRSAAKYNLQLGS